MKKIKCDNLKMLAMEAFDGEISPENSLILKAHLESCPGCREFAADLEKMKSVMPVYEPPKGLSEKIMNAVINEEMKKSKAPSFRRVFALSGITTAAFALTLLIITSTGNQKDIITIADMPVQEPVITAKKHAELKTAVIAKQDPAVTAVEKTDKPVITASKPVFESASETEKGPGAQRVVSIASTGSEQAKPASVADKREQSGAVAAAKVTPIAPPQNRLLDTEKAIVGNNVINISTGSRAIIRVKVEEASPVRIIIYDKRIKPVKVIVDEQKDPGVYEAFWDARNDNGQIVTEGVYYVYIQIGKAVIKKNVVVTR